MTGERLAGKRLATITGLLLGIVALAILALAGTLVHARCEEPPPPREALALSDAVFRGIATDIAPDQVGDPKELEVEFVVDHVWKGEVVRHLTVRTYPQSDSMGYPFAVGTEYLVYAVRWSDPFVSPRPPEALWTTPCSRTKPYDPAEALELGAGKTVLRAAYLPLTRRR